MQNIIFHALLTDVQPNPTLSSDGHLPASLYTQNKIFYAMEYPFGQFRSGAMAMLPPTFLCTCSLTEHGKLKSSCLRVNPTQQQLEHHRITAYAEEAKTGVTRCHKVSSAVMGI